MKDTINMIVNSYVKFNEANQNLELDELNKYDEAYQVWLNEIADIAADKIVRKMVKKLTGN